MIDHPEEEMAVVARFQVFFTGQPCPAIRLEPHGRTFEFAADEVVSVEVRGDGSSLPAVEHHPEIISIWEGANMVVTLLNKAGEVLNT